jgi:hypothetical protein
VICYHGTSEEVWQEIQEDGQLWGVPPHSKGKPGAYRFTYLSPEREVAEEYGPVVLQVEYDPVGPDGPEGRGIDNFGFNPPPGQTCWQFSVFVPISLDRVKRIK